MPDIAPILDNIRAEMTRRRITQRAAADALGISQPALNARLAGRTPLDVGELLTLAALMDIEPSALLLTKTAA